MIQKNGRGIFSGFLVEANKNYNASHMGGTKEVTSLNPIYVYIIKFVIIPLLFKRYIFKYYLLKWKNILECSIELNLHKM